MKSTFAALAAALLLAVAGCGGEQENMSAQYPPAPPPGVSSDAPPQDVAASEAPNAQSQASAEASAQGYAQPQQGDIQVGVDANANGYEDTDPAALTDFKTTLDPYGTWREDSTYGTVWTPSTTVVGSDFAPYQTAGHWTYDDDYVWVSDYEWGWAPFHYGRWVYVGAYGWSWIPGRVYSGAWVTWRHGYYDDYYVGWAPLPPTWYWYGGVAVGIGYVPVAPYVFCRSSYVFAPTVAGHVVTGAQVPVVASHTRPYVPATPAVAAGGRVAARPTVGGPPPGQIGLKGAQIPRSPAGNRGLMHAQQFASPSTATQMGARPPQTVAQAPRMSTINPGPARSNVGSSPGVAGGRAIGSNPAPSVGAHGPVATSPQYRGIAPTPYRAPSPSAAQRFSSPSSPSYSAPRPSTPSYSAPHYSTPSYSAPHYSTPSYSAPHYSAPSSPSFHSAAPSTPSYHSTMPSYHSAPSRPSGGGGGFHGGGARGGRR
jgi:hypothetical protein